MDYFERKKLKEETEKYRTICWILAVIIVVMGILWYQSDNSRMKWIHELQEEVETLKEEINQ